MGPRGRDVEGLDLRALICRAQGISGWIGDTEMKIIKGVRGLKPGARVNLEQPLTAGKEFGGHFVLGHVDSTGSVAAIDPEGDSWRYVVHVPEEIAKYVVPKGSITIDGISLTVAHWENQIAEIAVIPFTFEHTNISDRKPGDLVNLEGDVLGKYVEQRLEARAKNAAKSSLSLNELISQGF